MVGVILKIGETKVVEHATVYKNVVDAFLYKTLFPGYRDLKH